MILINKKKNSTAANRYLNYLKKYPREILGAFICGISGGSMSVLMTYYTGKSIDTMIGKGKVDFPELFQILGLLLVSLFISVVTQWLVQYLGNRTAYRSVAELRKDTFVHLDQLPISFFDQTSHGNLVSRFTNDLDYVSEACAAIFNSLFTGITVVCLSFIAMLLLNPILTLIVLITTPILFIITWIVAHTSQNNFTGQQKVVGEISGYISEIVGNQKIVQAFQQEKASQNHFDQLNSKLLVWGQKAQFTSSLTNPLSRFVDHLAYAAIGAVGGILILSHKGGVTLGVISSFTIYSSQFSKPFIELSGLTTQIQTALAGLQRIFEIQDHPIEKPDTQPLKKLVVTNGTIDFKNVFFSYTPTQPLIQDLSLQIDAGSTVAIVGKTGAGKSTLVNLLMRFYDIQKGKILIDGVDICQYTRDSLRKSFGMVLQDTWLFDGTIRENLSYGRPDATDAEIEFAAKEALVHSFIEKLPQKYETVLGSSGLQISNGQRQLLTIARTMVSDPPMLILDEATSSVDTLTERQIQTAFLKMMKGKTSFVIAHRLATIQEAEKILVMDNGMIVEIGTHKELLQRKDGYYSKLYQAQFAHNDF